MTAWADALALALTGSPIPATRDKETPEPPTRDDAPPAPSTRDKAEADILSTLAAVGWTPQRLVASAQSLWSRGEPWPHPVPEAAARFGAARWQAALDSVRHQLGLDVVPHAPSRRTRLTADELRLVADRPPHYG